MSSLEQFRSQFEATTAWRFVNQRLLEIGDGYSRLELPLEPFANTLGSAHGGALAFLLDSAMAIAVRTIVGVETATPTIELKINFLAPARGTKAYGEGKVIRVRRKIAVVEGRVLSETGEVLAVALGSFTVRRSVEG